MTVPGSTLGTAGERGGGGRGGRGRRRCVAPFGEARGEAGTERLVVLAESRLTEPAERALVERDVVARVAAVVGLPPDVERVVPLGPALWVLTWSLPAGRPVRRLTNFACHVALVITGCRLRVEGRERLSRSGPCVLVANHTSDAGTPAPLSRRRDSRWGGAARSAPAAHHARRSAWATRYGIVRQTRHAAELTFGRTVAATRAPVRAPWPPSRAGRPTNGRDRVRTGGEIPC